MRVWILLTVAVVLVGDQAWAIGCRRRTVVQQVVAAPVQQVCVQPVVQRVVQKAAVVQPQAVMFLVAPPNYYGAASYAQGSQVAQSRQRQGQRVEQVKSGSYDAEASDNKLADAIDRQTKSFDRALTVIVSRLEKIESRLGIESTGSSSEPEPIPEPAQDEPTPAEPITEESPSQEIAARIISQQCGLCHGSETGSGQAGGFRLSDLAGDVDTIDRAISAVEDDRMPQNELGQPQPLEGIDRQMVLSALKQLRVQAEGE